jgi:redox-sensitive bicupin YhaK (pirin superfamily)
VLAYVFEGQASFGAANDEAETTVGASQMVVFNDGDRIDAQTGPQPVRFLLMSGKPSYEPIFRYGPFVMNTREEIEQTLRELRAGVFPPSD